MESPFKYFWDKPEVLGSPPIIIFTTESLKLSLCEHYAKRPCFAISILRLIGYANIAKALRDMMAKPHLTLRLLGI